MVHERGAGRVLWAVVASALTVAVFFGWYVTFGPGALVGGQSSAMQALASKTPPRTASPGATVSSVLAPPVASPSRGVVAAGTLALPATEEAALALLEKESASERKSAQIEGLWVAQLASKYVGTVDPLQVNAAGEHKFSAVDIYAEHAALQERLVGTRVLLLDSRNVGAGRVFEGKPYWVTVATDPAFTSADRIVQWCGEKFPELTGTALTNQCFATQVPLTAG